MIELTEDFRDLLIELADAGADFVVLGGHAVAYHGHPRATKDLDVLVRANRDNAARVYQALLAAARRLAPAATLSADSAALAVDHLRRNIWGRSADEAAAIRLALARASRAR